MRGGGGTGGSMLRSVGRTMRTGTVPDSFSAASNPIRSSHTKFISSANALSLSSAPSYEASFNVTPASSSTSPTWPPPLYQIDDWDWVSVDAANEESEDRGLVDCVFGRVPCADEVQSAIHALEKVIDLSEKESTNTFSTNLEKDMNGIRVPSEHSLSSVGSVSDWKEPSPNALLKTNASQKVYDALYLLKTEPSVQKMVISLSSDQAVWDAVLNNEAVQDLRRSYFAAETKGIEISDDREGWVDAKPAIPSLGWLFDGTKEKLTVLFDKIMMLLNPLFHWEGEDEEKKNEEIDGNLFQKRLNSSLMICVVVLFLVVVARAGGV